MLTGDVDPMTAQTLAARHFGDWPRADDPFVDHPVPMQPDLHADVSDNLTADVSASRLVVAYQGPSRSDDFRASVAADVLAQLTQLSDQEFRSLVSPPAITSAVVSHYASSHKDVIAFELEIASGFEPGSIANLGETQKRLARSITGDQLLAAKAALWEKRLSAADQNLNLALELGSDWALAPPGDAPDYVTTLYGLKLRDIVDLIDRYILGHHHATVLLTDPEHTVSNLDAVLERSL